MQHIIMELLAYSLAVPQYSAKFMILTKSEHTAVPNKPEKIVVMIRNNLTRNLWCLIKYKRIT